MMRPRAAIAIAIESTRNGMSSLTMPMRIRRCPSWRPWSPGGSRNAGRPAAGAGRDEGGRFAPVRFRKVAGLARQAALDEGTLQGLEIGLVGGASRSHAAGSKAAPEEAAPATLSAVI
jgi:hypothetical protein